jgi:hypothetical protein
MQQAWMNQWWLLLCMRSRLLCLRLLLQPHTKSEE